MPDVPMNGRFMVIPPVAANDMLGIKRFTEQQYIGDGDAIKTGKIGSIYGMDVYVSSNCPSIESGAARVWFDDAQRCSSTCRATKCSFSDTVQARVPW